VKHAEKISPSVDMVPKILIRTIPKLNSGLRDIRPAIKSLSQGNILTNVGHCSVIHILIVCKEKHDTKFGRNTREVWNIKHSANIAEIESLKHTKSYHIRRCEHRTLCENEDPTWRHYSYSDTQKKTIVYLIKYVMLMGKLILLDSQPCQWHYLRNLQYSCLCQFTQQTGCEYVVLILYASLFYATLHISTFFSQSSEFQ
jgi:hypothetical protein